MKRSFFGGLAIAAAMSIGLCFSNGVQAQPRATGAAAKPSMTICTGRSDGIYFPVGQIISKFTAQSINTNVVTSDGSDDNMQRMVEGNCDAAIVQNDAYRLFSFADARAISQIDRATVLYKETVHLVCNRDAKIKSISDLTNKHTVAVGEEKSGSQRTWENFKAANPKSYGNIPTSPRGGVDAISAVADGSEVTCALIVSGLGSKLMKGDGVSRANSIVLATIDDSKLGDLKDAKNRSIYSSETIPSSTYGALMPSGIFGKKDVETVGVDAILVTNTNWVNNNKSARDNLLRAVNMALPGIRDRIGLPPLK